MREATVIPPGGGEVIGDSPERRVEILCDDEALNATWSRFVAGRPTALAVVGEPVVDVEEIVVREVSAPAGARMAAARREQLQCFYVLDGELVLAAGGRELGAAAGAWVLVPAGAAYELSFPQAARFLELRAPR